MSFQPSPHGSKPPRAVATRIEAAATQRTPDTLSRFSQLLLAIYRHAQELPVQEFQDAVLRDLKAFVPFDSSMWGTATMESAGIDIHSIWLHNSPQAMLDAYEKVKHQDRAAVIATRQARSTTAFHAREVYDDAETAGILQLCTDFGHENGLITCDIHPLTRFVHWISLYRRTPDARYTAADLELVGQAAPHIMQALAINRLLQFDRGVSDLARSQWSVAIADNRGLLYHADTAFRELLQAEWPGTTDGGDRLPSHLLDALRENGGRIVGCRAVLQRSLEHGVLFLRARRRHPVDELSQRELTVARLLADGLTQKEVARQLERSPETIRSQVKAVFDKLGIGSAVLLGAQLSLRD